MSSGNSYENHTRNLPRSAVVTCRRCGRTVAGLVPHICRTGSNGAPLRCGDCGKINHASTEDYLGPNEPVPENVP